MIAVETHSLVKDYGGWSTRTTQPALASVSLKIPAGSIFGLLGPNGAGKTTLVKSLLGIVRPTSGEIRVFGSSPDDVTVRRRIGYLPERLQFPPGLSALDYVSGMGRLRGLPQPREAALVQLKRVGMADDASRRVSEFSKGMRQRVGMAGALLGEPDLLILDEPTDGVDPIGRAEFRSIIQSERSRGATVVINSHLLAETEQVCDTIGILVKGRLARTGPIDELTQDVSDWRVNFGPGADSQRLAALGFERCEEEKCFVAPGAGLARLNQMLDQAREAGALIQGVGPRVQKLESLVLSTVKQEGE